MANLRKRGTSQWQAQVRVCGYPNQTKTFNTRAEAERWAKATEVEMAQGSFLSRANAQTTTLGDLLDGYFTEVTPRKKKAPSPKRSELERSSDMHSLVVTSLLFVALISHASATNR
jgi:hypothetical protein